MANDDRTVAYPGLDRKTALVTGSNRNIGRAIAVALGKAGANVGITAQSDRESCEQTATAVERAGGKATIALGNLGDPDDIVEMVDIVRDELGPLDVLVDNAAIRPSVPFEEISLKE